MKAKWPISISKQKECRNARIHCRQQLIKEANIDY